MTIYFLVRLLVTHLILGETFGGQRPGGTRASLVITPATAPVKPTHTREKHCSCMHYPRLFVFTPDLYV